MARFRISDPARADLEHILATSQERWGREGRVRYTALLAEAMRKIAGDPEGPITRERSAPLSGVRSLHLRPLVHSHLNPFTIADDQELEPDESMRGRIKWYVKPLIFGGDPNFGENIAWVTVEQHAELVTWWNAKYREVAGR